jgi:hypothetical protein
MTQDLPELERDGFGLLLCIDLVARGTFGHVAAGLANQPLPLATDMQDAEITRRESRLLDRETAVFAAGSSVSLDPCATRCGSVRLRRRIPALIAIFELAGTAVALQRDAEASGAAGSSAKSNAD